MDFESLKKSPLFAVIIGFVLFNATLFGFSFIMIDKVATKVIYKLQKEYSPGQGYGPRLDPDKVHPDALRRTTKKVEYTENGQNTITTPVTWDQSWESERL